MRNDRQLPPRARGSVVNPDGRFERRRREAFDDGWDHDDEEPPPLATTVSDDATRSIITRNDSPDVPFDRSINPYRGCEHGCSYCFARPGHSYLGLSPGLDFETRLFAKPRAAELLDAELRRPGYKVAPIAIGTNTDPYQPIERQRRIMRGCLEVLAAFDHPVCITTKSFLVTRDIDILAPMAAKGLAMVSISVTTLDRDLCRRLEPRAAVPSKRLEAIRRLARSGIPVAVMAAPVIPALTDHELEAILEAAAEAGATSAAYVLLRLPHEVKDLFAAWLETHYPARASHVLSLMRQSRDGRLYDARFESRYKGTGVHAQLLARRFAVAAARLGLAQRDLALDCSRFRPPPKVGDQLRLW